jgi:hypothetical protein
MRIIGCDLHARQQTLAKLDSTTGEGVKITLKQEGNNVRVFYSTLPRPVRVGIEARGSMQWFVSRGLGTPTLMRGSDLKQDGMFSYVSPVQGVPAEHSL